MNLFLSFLFCLFAFSCSHTQTNLTKENQIEGKKSLDLGYTALKNGDTTEAKLHFEKSCSKLNLGCANLGKIEFDNGHFSEAKKLYEKACETDHYLCTSIAYYELDRSNPDNAEKYFLEAAEAGNMYGYYALGKMKEKANDFNDAENYYQKACDGGIDSACTNILNLNVKKLDKI